MALKKITSPKGTAMYPHLRQPEMYEGSEVGYTITMMFSKADTEKIEKFLKEELEAAKNSSEFKGKSWKNARLGIKEDKNGDKVVKFKTSTAFKGRNGEVIPRTIPIFDAHGNVFKGDIGNGSICKVSFSVGAYHKSSTNCGLSLYLQAVQVLDRKEPGGMNADSYGFSKNEDGFVANDDSAEFGDEAENVPVENAEF